VEQSGRFEDLLDPSTPAYARYREQIDEVARGLADLQDAGVPVLFRPFHEMTGAFWWGSRNPVAFRKVWRELFTYFTEAKGLHNLVWVWSPLVSSRAMDYYPGNAFVDVTGLDIYAASVAVATNVYADLMKTGKPFAVTEFGPRATRWTTPRPATTTTARSRGSARSTCPQPASSWRGATRGACTATSTHGSCSTTRWCSPRRAGVRAADAGLRAVHHARRRPAHGRRQGVPLHRREHAGAGRALRLHASPAGAHDAADAVGDR
jgi:hypothetical protein